MFNQSCSRLSDGKYVLFKDPNYKLEFYVDKYNDQGYPVQFHYQDNVPVSRKYSVKGELLMECYNMTYDVISQTIYNPFIISNGSASVFSYIYDHWNN